MSKQIERPPVVTLMGHVDHGKTSILDAIKQTKVHEGEAGGITQHVRAHQITHKKKKITFIDTPGHSAFKEMRSRGGNIADIGILVVALDDSVKPQTKEAIELIKNSGAKMIVAANKMDLPGVDVRKVKQDLANNDVLVEDFGGDIPFVEISAKEGKNIDQLLEIVLLVAEMEELKETNEGAAEGVVLESNLDAKLGSVSTILVQKGTLNKGDFLLSDGNIGKLRAMIDTTGEKIEVAGPSDVVSVLGVSAVLEVGQRFYSSDNQKSLEKMAKEFERVEESIQEQNADEINILDLLGAQEEESNKKYLKVVLKTDVSGTLEALKRELQALEDEEVGIEFLQTGTGSITEDDVIKAKAARGLVLGFNVELPTNVREVSKREKVIVRSYDVIYDLIDEIDEVMTSLVEPDIIEEITAEVLVKQPFTLSDGTMVAGSVIESGTVSKGSKIYVERDGSRMIDGKVSSLKVLKDDVKEVRTGQECGIIIDQKFVFEEGDKILVFKIEK